MNCIVVPWMPYCSYLQEPARNTLHLLWICCLILTFDDLQTSCPEVCGLLGFFILSMRLSYFVQTNAAAKRKVQQGEQVRCQDSCDSSISLLLKTVLGTLHFGGTDAFKFKIIQILSLDMLFYLFLVVFPSFFHAFRSPATAMVARL